MRVSGRHLRVISCKDFFHQHGSIGELSSLAVILGCPRRGVRVVHLGVVVEIDAGPIIAQEAIDVRDDDTEAALAERVLEVEHRLYPRALREVAAGRTKLTASRTDNG